MVDLLQASTKGNDLFSSIKTTHGGSNDDGSRTILNNAASATATAINLVPHKNTSKLFGRGTMTTNTAVILRSRINAVIIISLLVILYIPNMLQITIQYGGKGASIYKWEQSELDNNSIIANVSISNTTTNVQIDKDAMMSPNLTRDDTKVVNSSDLFFSNNHETIISSMTKPATMTPTPTMTTLAMLDPYLIGGFRNQHMRLVGLVYYATQKNISNILLDSIFYENKAVSRKNATLGRIRYDELFNVSHWNDVSQRVGTHVLPRLVPYSPIHHKEWNPESALFHGLKPITDTDVFHFRQEDTLPYVRNFTQPYGYGSGGKIGKRLWTSYMKMKKKDRNGQFSATERAIIEAVQPARRLKNAIENITVANGMMDDLLVIHPRTEPEMLRHRCSRGMTRNLTTILEMVESSDYFRGKFNQAFFCISRSQMESIASNASTLKTLIDQNLVTLNRATSHGLLNGTVPVREGGEPFVKSFGFPLDMIDTAAQVINFFIAVRGSIFVGTFGSSYSTDVWTSRYTLNPSNPGNYRHSPTGIHKVEGFPPKHHC